MKYFPFLLKSVKELRIKTCVKDFVGYTNLTWVGPKQSVEGD